MLRLADFFRVAGFALADDFFLVAGFFLPAFFLLTTLLVLALDRDFFATFFFATFLGDFFADFFVDFFAAFLAVFLAVFLAAVFLEADFFRVTFFLPADFPRVGRLPADLLLAFLLLFFFAAGRFFVVVLRAPAAGRFFEAVFLVFGRVLRLAGLRTAFFLVAAFFFGIAIGLQGVLQEGGNYTDEAFERKAEIYGSLAAAGGRRTASAGRHSAARCSATTVV